MADKTALTPPRSPSVPTWLTACVTAGLPTSRSELMKPLVHQHMLMSVFLTCTEPGSVPGQNYVDLEAAVCWLKWDWEAVPVNWVPAHRGDRGRDGAYLFQLGRILC